MEAWQILKLVHVVSVVIALGANLTYAFWLSRAGLDRERLVFVIDGIRRLDRRVANPAYIVTLLAGVGMVLTGPFRFEALWISAAIALYVLVAVLGITLYAPALRRQLALATVDPGTSGYAAAARRAQAIGLLVTGLVLVIVALMILKPTI
ncbi:MAG: DUF2269 family protein [Chloroflexota bacterium]